MKETVKVKSFIYDGGGEGHFGQFTSQCVESKLNKLSDVMTCPLNSLSFNSAVRHGFRCQKRETKTAVT